MEIKATFKKSVAFRSEPEHCIVVKLNLDGTFEEVYNGPGALVWGQFAGRPRPSNGAYAIGLTKLEKLGRSVPVDDRIERID